MQRCREASKRCLMGRVLASQLPGALPVGLVHKVEFNPSRGVRGTQSDDVHACVFDHSPPGIVCAYVYGSVARGTSHQASDFDVSVLYSHDPPPTFDGLGLALGGELERHLGKPVDLLIFNRATVP